MEKVISTCPDGEKWLGSFVDKGIELFVVSKV